MININNLIYIIMILILILLLPTTLILSIIGIVKIEVVFFSIFVSFIGCLSMRDLLKQKTSNDF